MVGVAIRTVNANVQKINSNQMSTLILQVPGKPMHINHINNKIETEIAGLVIDERTTKPGGGQCRAGQCRTRRMNGESVSDALEFRRFWKILYAAGSHV